MTYYISIDTAAELIKNKKLQLVMNVKDNTTIIQKDKKLKNIPLYQINVYVNKALVKFVRGTPTHDTTPLALHCWNIVSPTTMYISSLRYKTGDIDGTTKLQKNWTTSDPTPIKESATLVLNVHDDDLATKLKMLQSELDKGVADAKKKYPDLKEPSYFIGDYTPPKSEKNPTPKTSTLINCEIDFSKWTDKHFIESLKNKEKSQVIEKKTNEKGEISYVPCGNGKMTLTSFMSEFKSYKVIGVTFYNFQYTQYKTGRFLIKPLIFKCIVEKIIVDDGDDIEITPAPKVDESIKAEFKELEEEEDLTL